MPTLKQLRKANRTTSEALADAERHLAEARNKAIDAWRELSSLEEQSLTIELPPEQLEAARQAFQSAKADLMTVRLALKPDEEPDGG
jgi:hypothetical protein